MKSSISCRTVKHLPDSGEGEVPSNTPCRRSQRSSAKAAQLAITECQKVSVGQDILLLINNRIQ